MKTWRELVAVARTKPCRHGDLLLVHDVPAALILRIDDAFEQGSANDREVIAAATGLRADADGPLGPAQTAPTSSPDAPPDTTPPAQP